MGRIFTGVDTREEQDSQLVCAQICSMDKSKGDWAFLAIVRLVGLSEESLGSAALLSYPGLQSKAALT